jgi:NDP-sugar pyrophosphorylase family protein
MKHHLICPGRREAVSQLAESGPLAVVPLLSQNLLEYWLAHLAATGARDVRILADDRPEYVEAVVGHGARWGLAVEVTAETRELTPAQVQIKYERELPAVSPADSIAVLDHFPGLPELPLFTSYADWLAGVLAWFPRVKTPDRVGVHEARPGVWVGMHTRVAPDAQLIAPCWIGSHCYVGARAVIGPMAVVEDRAFVEPGAEISWSIVGPDTLVGQYTEVRDSFAWGGTLINWKTNSCIRVADAFLLCALRHPTPPRPAKTSFSRLLKLDLREDVQMLWKHFLMNKEG